MDRIVGLCLADDGGRIDVGAPYGNAVKGGIQALHYLPLLRNSVTNRLDYIAVIKVSRLNSLVIAEAEVVCFDACVATQLRLELFCLGTAPISLRVQSTAIIDAGNAPPQHAVSAVMPYVLKSPPPTLHTQPMRGYRYPPPGIPTPSYRPSIAASTLYQAIRPCLQVR